jgi:acyl carrier protein
LNVRGGIEAEQIDFAKRFENYGLDSLMAIELFGDLEDACDAESTPTVAMGHPTIFNKMSTLVTGFQCGKSSATSGLRKRLESASAS